MATPWASEGKKGSIFATNVAGARGSQMLQQNFKGVSLEKFT